MNKQSKVSALLLGLTLLTGCSGSKAEKSSEQAPPPAKILVTLGDSISAGFGLENPVEQRYSALTASALEARDSTEWEDCNYAVSGDDSSDLVRRLQEGTAEQLPNADMIVLYIGANNLLGPFTEYLTGLLENVEFSEGEDADPLKDILTRIATDTDALKNLKSNIETRMTQLKADLDSIYAFIRNENKDAPIYLLNVYNPYADFAQSNALLKNTLGTFTVGNLENLNAELAAFADAHADITQVDIASAFAACAEIPIQGDINNGLNLQGGLSNVDPHPNADGQKIIADTLLTAINTVQQSGESEVPDV